VVNKDDIDKNWQDKVRNIELDRVYIESIEKKKDKLKSKH